MKNKTIVTFALLTALLLSCGPVFAEGKWGGVDESVVEKIAEEHGRKAAEPLINTDQGDLLLFVFLLAGAVGGFAAGYSWKSLTQKTEARTQKPDMRTKNTEHRQGI